MDDDYNLFPDIDEDYNLHVRQVLRARWYEYANKAIIWELDQEIFASLEALMGPKPKPIFSEPFRFLEGLEDGRAEQRGTGPGYTD
jgi:hypothetical protein